jgi:uncharacterized protein
LIFCININLYAYFSNGCGNHLSTLPLTNKKGGRKDHLHYHFPDKSSGRILREDKVLREFLLPDNSPLFTPEQIEVMAQAVEDHRASSSTEPRSIYGKIVAEADRIIDGPTIVRRTIQYGLSNYPHLNKDGHYQRFLKHMAEKYACGGYLKLWIPESPNAARLAAFQNVLEDPIATRNMFEEEWKKLIAR